MILQFLSHKKIYKLFALFIALIGTYIAGGCSESSQPAPSESRDDKMVGIKQLAVSKNDDTAVLMRSRVKAGQISLVSSTGDASNVATNAWQIIGWNQDGRYLLYLGREHPDDAGDLFVFDHTNRSVRKITDLSHAKFLCASWLVGDQIAMGYDMPQDPGTSGILLVLSTTGATIRQQNFPPNVTPISIAPLDGKGAALEATVFTGKKLDYDLYLWDTSAFHLVQDTQGCSGLCKNPTKPEVAIEVVGDDSSFSEIKTVNIGGKQSATQPILTASQFPAQTEVTGMEYAPDGLRLLIATISNEDKNQSYIYDTSAQHLIPVVSSSVAGFSADGKRIVYAESSSVRYRNTNNLYSSGVDGSDVKLLYRADRTDASLKLIAVLFITLTVITIAWLISRRRASLKLK